MGKISKIIRERMANSTFCYSVSGGQGFINKNNCECSCNKELNCQAYRDMKKFHSYFEGLSYEESIMKRKEIINSIKDEFKDSQWYKDNVIE